MPRHTRRGGRDALEISLAEHHSHNNRLCPLAPPNERLQRAPKKKDEGEGEEHGEPKRQRRTPRGTSSNAYLSEALVEKSGTAGETSGTAKGEGDCQVEQVKALVMDTIESNGEDPIKIGEIYSVVQKHDGGILKSQMDKKTLQHYLQLLVHEGVVEHVKRKGYILKKEDDQIVMGMGDDGDQVQPDQLLEVGNGGCCDVTAAADAKLKAELARKNAAEAEALYQMRKKEATAAVNAAEEAKARAATLKAIEAAALAAVDQVRPPPKKQR